MTGAKSRQFGWLAGLELIMCGSFQGDNRSAVGVTFCIVTRVLTAIAIARIRKAGLCLPIIMSTVDIRPMLVSGPAYSTSDAAIWHQSSSVPDEKRVSQYKCATKKGDDRTSLFVRLTRVAEMVMGQ